MMTKPELIKVLIKEYDAVLEHLFKYVDKHDYHEDSQLHVKEGRLAAFKECIIGHSEENTVSIKDVNEEISRELIDNNIRNIKKGQK